MNVSQTGAAIATDNLLPLAASASAAPATKAIATGFAALLAGVLTPPLPAATTPVPATPNSELDVKGDAKGSDESASTTKKDDSATDATTLPDISLAALGVGAAGLSLPLKMKLARVITRMKSEFGRDVKVVEGVRSQQRQNQLFAQGRSTAGPIVTWTSNSLHTAGRAADVVIDGGYDDAAGFALLRQVAEQEGLHTLGARDPGHVELRGSARAAERASDAIAGMIHDGVPALGQTFDPQQQGKRTTGVRATEPNTAESRTIDPHPNVVVAAIGVARVASVARVATVARVAEPGVSARLDGAPPRVAAPTTAGSVAQSNGGGASAKANNSANSNASSNSGDGRDTAPRRATLAAHQAEAGADTRSGESAYRTLDHTRVSGGSIETPAVDARGDASSITAAHTVRAMDAQDAPGPRTLSRLTLSLDDGPQGAGQDQVRIGMRGSSVGASFEMHDATSADRVSARLGELTRALEQRGLEPQAFQVRTSSTSREADVARVATQAAEAQRTVANTSAMRHDTRPDFGGDARQRFAQHDDQQERAQRRQDEQRRRQSSFSLASEES